MNRLCQFFLVSCAALSAAASGPSPTRAELEVAQGEVREIVADVLDDLRGGKLAYADAAEEVRIRASQVEKPAEEYLLLQGAFRLFMRAGEYPRAVDLLRHMRARDFPPEALASLAEQALEPVPRGKPVAGLDALLATLRDEIAHVRKRKSERELDLGLDGRVPSGFPPGPEGTILDVAEGVRACVLERGGRSAPCSTRRARRAGGRDASTGGRWCLRGRPEGRATAQGKSAPPAMRRRRRAS